MSVDVTLSCEIKIKLAQAPYHTSCGKSDALPKIFANSQGYHGYLCFHIPPPAGLGLTHISPLLAALSSHVHVDRALSLVSLKKQDI